MQSPRAVRIPRAGPPRPEAAPAPAPAPGTFRPNRAGTQRATRLSVLFLVVLAALYVGFVLVQRGAVGATSPGGRFDLYFFTAITAAVAVVGVVVAIGQAPRGIEVTAAATVVVGRFGTRSAFPALGTFPIRQVRSYRTAFLSSTPVAVYELAPARGASRTLLIEQGIFDAPP
jgi:hypothetical protein